MSAAIDQKRLQVIAGIELSRGGHDSMADGACVMEAVSWIAGEPWSDRPKCACSVISTFLRAWNDALSKDDRNRLLKPLIPRLVGTRGSDALARRRSLMAADWLVRVHAPAWLRLAGLTEQADALSGLPEITDMAQVPSIKPAIEAAQKDASAAGDAARAAAMDAARAAAMAAARAAARAAAWDAAWDAAVDAAMAAAGNAARAAAVDAAWDAAVAAAVAAARVAAGAAAVAAAWVVLKPTMQELQISALKLVERMIEARDMS